MQIVDEKPYYDDPAEIFANIGGWPPPAPPPRDTAPLPLTNARPSRPPATDAVDLFRRWADAIDTAAGSANSRGGRNKAAYDIACEGLGRGLDSVDVLQVVLSYCNRSGLPDHEGESTWRSACQRHADSPFSGNAPEQTHRAVIASGRTVAAIAPPELTSATARDTGPMSTSCDVEPFPLADGDFPPTGTGNADRFAATFDGKMLHCEGEGWIAWNGKFWDTDPKVAHHNAHRFALAMLDEVKQAFVAAAAALAASEAAMNEAKSVIGPAAIALHRRWDELKQEEETLSAKAKRLAKNSESLNRASGPAELLKAAESQPAFRITEEQLDADPFLLNVENGVIDLRTKTLYPHDPSRRITKYLPIAYDPTAGCPRWSEFVKTILMDDMETVAFVQRALGYSLTGSTREQVFFLCIGGGGNGKSTMLEVVKTLLRGYARSVEHTTILDQNRSGAGPSTDIARLRAARFVTINEMPEGKRMDVNRIKDWTGGDTIVTRHLYRAAFEFQPAFKMWIRANTEPPFRETDEGTWRRVRVIPFMRRFEGESKNDTLKESLLEAESAGILAWLVDGAARWFMEGLGTANVIHDATSKYRLDLDVLQHFIDDRVIRHPDQEIRSSRLYETYATWCESNGERPLTQTTFSSRMQKKGFERMIRRDFTWWTGITVREQT